MTDSKLLSRETVFSGRMIEVARERVSLPGGDAVDLEIVHHPGGAAVVALDEQDRVCLLRQFRHASGGWLWELPAGRIDPNEQPFTTAQRELAEEAGLAARDWTELGLMHSSPGIFTEVIHLWLATGLSSLPIAHEPGEVIEIHWLPLEQALDWCGDGTITDGKTLIGLYRAGDLIRDRLALLSEDPGC